MQLEPASPARPPPPSTSGSKLSPLSPAFQSPGSPHTRDGDGTPDGHERPAAASASLEVRFAEGASDTGGGRAQPSSSSSSSSSSPGQGPPARPRPIEDESLARLRAEVLASILPPESRPGFALGRRAPSVAAEEEEEDFDIILDAPVIGFDPPFATTPNGMAIGPPQDEEASRGAPLAAEGFSAQDAWDAPLQPPLDVTPVQQAESATQSAGSMCWMHPSPQQLQRCSMQLAQKSPNLLLRNQ